MILKNPISEPLDIIILAGQSNMEGCGRGEAEKEWIPSEKILMMQSEIRTRVEKYIVPEPSDEYYIEPADERYSSDYGMKCGVFALEFARLYSEQMLTPGRKLLLVQSAVGGTGFVGGHWGTSDILYKRMLEMVSCALGMNPENRIVAMLWHQGEHDAYERRGEGREQIASEYEKALTALIEGVRERFGNGFPIVAAGFTHGWVDEYPEECEAVLSATERAFSKLGKSALVTGTGDLKSNSDVIGGDDNVHFSKAACKILASRYFDAYEALIKSN